MTTFVAISPRDGLALFDVEGSGVVVNTRNMDVCDPKPMTIALGERRWTKVAKGAPCPIAWTDLASAASTSLNVTGVTADGSSNATLSSFGRLFRVPKGVQHEAKRALSKSKVGLSEDDLSLGRRLANGEPVTLKDVKRIHEYLSSKSDAELETASAEETAKRATFGNAAGLRWSGNLLKRNGLLDIMVVPVPSAAPDAMPDEPHEFVPSPDDPMLCEICQLDENDPIHVAAAAPNPNAIGATGPTPTAPIESDPDTPHEFSDDGSGLCAVCGRTADDVVHIPVLASAFTYEDECLYFGVKESPDDDNTHVVALLMKRPDDTWAERRGADWFNIEGPAPDELLIELDMESATTLADAVDQSDDPENFSLALSAICPADEWEMFALAESGIDWEAVDRVLDVYDPMERSVNAKRQTRDNGGRFGGSGAGGGPTGYGSPGSDPAGGGDESEEKPPEKARLSESLPLVADVKALIDTYISGAVVERAAKDKGDAPQGDDPLLAAGPMAPPVEAPASPIPSPQPTSGPATGDTPETSDVRPLYLAIVDSADTQAVLDVIALIPGSGDGTNPMCFKRDNGEWVRAEDLLRDLRGITPPPVVELDDATLADCLSQMDPVSEEATSEIASDGAPMAASASMLSVPTAKSRKKAASKGFALPDGSFPINDEADLKKAIKAYGRASDKAAAKKHIMKRARGLGRADLIPDDWKGKSNAVLGEMQTPLWGPNGEILKLVAAGTPGVADTPGDVKNVQRLREYWTHGKGASKIQWGVDGDWKRCVKQLRKYLGNRAKGYCTLRHHEATGSWPGKGPHVGAHSLLEEFGLRDFESYEAITAAAAQYAHEIDGEAVPDTAEEVQEGAKFRLPLVIPEGVPSGDGREFSMGSLTTRDMPIPLLWQIKTDEGHTGSVIVGRIDSVDRLENGLGNGVGVFDTGPFGREAERLVREKFLRGISGDLDEFEAQVSDDGQDETRVTSGKMVVDKARLMAVTLVPKPAFQECYIELVGDEPVQEAIPVPDGVYEEDRPIAAAAEHALAALAASAAPVSPPAEWFHNPELEKPTALTVLDDGRVFGHIAAWDVDHIGMPFGTRPPKSRSNYAYFQTGALKTAEGNDVRVGQLTLAGGHAPLQADATAAVKHYDDTASAVADVSAGEDLYGIWVAGALRPEVSPEQVRVLRASAPSGDWRPIGGALELVAVCQVNVPGFPIARTMVAGGQVMALVAAGASSLAALREQPMSLLEQRLQNLETFEQRRLAARREALSSRFAPYVSDHEKALSAKAEKARMAFASYFEAEKVLEARKLELSERVLGLRVQPDFEEHKHPRASNGKFRKIFARLHDELKDNPEAADAVQGLNRAADKEESGDKGGADSIAEDVKNQLDDIAQKTGDSKVVSAVKSVAAEIGDAATGDQPDAASDGGGGTKFLELPEVLQDLIKRAMDQILTKVDPSGLGTVESHIKDWMTGDGFASPADIGNFLTKYAKQKVSPDI